MLLGGGPLGVDVGANIQAGAEGIYWQGRGEEIVLLIAQQAEARAPFSH